MSEFQVLLVEDDAGLREALLDTLRAAQVPAIACSDAKSALGALEAERCDLVISDVHMPGINGVELLSAIKRRRPEIPVVLMTAYGNIDKAVAAMREGATDYIVKPFDAGRLLDVVRRQQASCMPPDEVVAEDPLSRRMLAMAARIGRSDATVLITGASGTGKEVYARYIRANSPRARAPFVAINCAAIPDNMLEATLFGYERGAFTGAAAAHAGKFEQAQGGTLLLDEISEMDLALQAKLLRVLQEREVERLGSSKTVVLDVRVIATSNRDLAAEVKAGRFRSDLFYRLNVMSLHLPDLAERRGDILALARRALLACHCGHMRFSAAAERALRGHEWAGNARELTNLVQRAALLTVGVEIDVEALAIDHAAHAIDHAAHAVMDAALGACSAAATDAHSPSIHETGASTADETDPSAGGDVPLEENLRERERDLILRTLRSAAGSRKLTAERLGISARTLRHKLQQFKQAGISVPSAHGGEGVAG